MASHGVRKLGLVTGLLMLLFLFLGAIPLLSIELHIVELPAGAGLVRLYTWGVVADGVAVHMFDLAWPSCIYSWMTTGLYMVAIALAVAASTPGSLPGNSKRMFGSAAVICGMQALLHAFIVGFSSFLPSFFLAVGPGFWALVAFACANVASLAKVH